MSSNLLNLFIIFIVSRSFVYSFIMKIYQLKDKNSNAEWFYRSITALCADRNICDYSREHLSLLKKKEGYPIERKKWVIVVREPVGMSDLPGHTSTGERHSSTGKRKGHSNTRHTITG